jgi:CBS domain containing-hemolysin-like protein
LVNVFTAVSNVVLRLAGIEPRKRSPLVTEEEIRLMIEMGKEQGVLLDHERQMLHRILEFGDLLVREVMIPREEMICAEMGSDTDTLLEKFVQEGHSRIPVYKQDVDHICGVIYARDILHLWRHDERVKIPDLVHVPFFVEPDKRVHELLREFQKRKLQIAIVKDTSGRVLGLVTIEDLLEEIVGEMDEAFPSPEDRSRLPREGRS